MVDVEIAFFSSRLLAAFWVWDRHASSCRMSTLQGTLHRKTCRLPRPALPCPAMDAAGQVRGCGEVLLQLRVQVEGRGRHVPQGSRRVVLHLRVRAAPHGRRLSQPLGTRMGLPCRPRPGTARQPSAFEACRPSKQAAQRPLSTSSSFPYVPQCAVPQRIQRMLA